MSNLDSTLRAELNSTWLFFLRPVSILRGYRREFLRPDFLAALTIAIIMLPQAIAFALIAELPPEMGLYTAIAGSIIAGLWGSSNHVQTGPTNTTSLLVLSALLMVRRPYLPATPPGRSRGEPQKSSVVSMLPTGRPKGLTLFC